MGGNLHNTGKETDWDWENAAGRARMLVQVLTDKRMDQTRLKQLLDAVDQRDQIDLKVLHNAVISCIKDYQNDSTASKLKDWKAAEKALNEKIDFLWSQHFGQGDPRLETIAAVLDYLKEKGWKATKTSLYRHQAEGKFLPQSNGTYLQKAVDKYANTFLKQQSTGKRVQTKIDEAHIRKADLEEKTLELELKRKQFSYEKDQGLYVPKGQMEIELAARAGILDAGLKHMIQSRVADWTRTVNGDIKKAGDLINIMTRDLDEHINSYATSREYEVIIDAEEEKETKEEEDINNDRN
jgi:hypothetical protein